MPVPTTIRPFTFDDIGGAALLLAERQRRDRERLPVLSKAFEDPTECAGVVRAAFETDFSMGVAAFTDGQMAGFLLAQKQLHPPTSLPAQFIPPHSLSFPLQGHAVADPSRATEVYRFLYAELSRQAVEQGYFEHRIAIIPGDRETEEAWVNLGFGRGLTCAVRDTGPVPNVVAGGNLEVHQAGPEDIDVVMQLEHTNETHHFRAPIFWPFLHETQKAAREYHVGLLEDPSANAHFIAYRDGRPIGMDTFNPPLWLNPLLQGGRMVYLYQGVVEEDARGGGVGKQLLAHSMAWAREQGYEWCGLHYASANPSGAAFWQSQGFFAVEHTMARHVDERVAWARP